VPAGPPILYCEFSLAPVTAPQRYDQCCRIGLCMRKTTNLDDISIFVAVAEAGTFSAAASYLQLPVSTISRSLTRLEKNMGLLLVRRSQRGLALTDSGKEYLLFCKRALRVLREGRELLDKNRASPSGLLRVACPMTMARDAIAPLLSKFIESFPDLRVELEAREGKSCRRIHSPLWQADSDKIRRMAPIEFIGRYMPGWFDYAICDEIHQLAGDTAQGNALATLASCTDRIVGLTGTLLGGYADDLFNTLFRLEAGRMKEHGYEWGTAGRSSFTQDYGVLETITKVEPAENRCSKAKTTSTVRRKPGASPLLFGEFLMRLCAFVFLEDISGELPPYEETYVSVPMDPLMMAAYRELEDAIRQALKEHKGNRSVPSTMLNTLLLYPDHPYGLGTLYGKEFDQELKRNVAFIIAETRDLPEDQLYSKERRLIEEVKKELARRTPRRLGHRRGVT